LVLTVKADLFLTPGRGNHCLPPFFLKRIRSISVLFPTPSFACSGSRLSLLLDWFTFDFSTLIFDGETTADFLFLFFPRSVPTLFVFPWPAFSIFSVTRTCFGRGQWPFGGRDLTWLDVLDPNNSFFCRIRYPLDVVSLVTRMLNPFFPFLIPPPCSPPRST